MTGLLLYGSINECQLAVHAQRYHDGVFGTGVNYEITAVPLGPGTLTVPSRPTPLVRRCARQLPSGKVVADQLSFRTRLPLEFNLPRLPPGVQVTDDVNTVSLGGSRATFNFRSMFTLPITQLRARPHIPRLRFSRQVFETNRVNAILIINYLPHSVNQGSRCTKSAAS